MVAFSPPSATGRLKKMIALTFLVIGVVIWFTGYQLEIPTNTIFFLTFVFVIIGAVVLISAFVTRQHRGGYFV